MIEAQETTSLLRPANSEQSNCSLAPCSAGMIIYNVISLGFFLPDLVSNVVFGKESYCYGDWTGTKFWHGTGIAVGALFLGGSLFIQVKNSPQPIIHSSQSDDSGNNEKAQTKESGYVQRIVEVISGPPSGNRLLTNQNLSLPSFQNKRPGNAGGSLKSIQEYDTSNDANSLLPTETDDNEINDGNPIENDPGSEIPADRSPGGNPSSQVSYQRTRDEEKRTQWYFRIWTICALFHTVIHAAALGTCIRICSDVPPPPTPPPVPTPLIIPIPPG